MATRWMARAATTVALVLALHLPGQTQTTNDTDALAALVRTRFDIVALQQGVALVPREAGTAVRLVQVVDGVIMVDGEALTGQQLRERLGADADLVLRISYLDAMGQRQLAGTPAGGAAAPPAQDTPPGNAEAGRVTRGDVVRFGGGVSVGPDERIQGDVVSFGGPVEVDGEVTGDVVAFGGPVRLGPRAIVRGDLTTIGGPLTQAPGARVFGSTNEIGAGGPGFERGRVWSSRWGPFWSRLGGLTATMVRVALLVLLGLLLVAFARRPLDRIAARTATAPVRAGLIGLLGQILFLPVLILTVVVLAVSIVGIPLLALVPFAVLLVMLAMLVGFVAVATRIGGRLTARLGWAEGGGYLSTALGIVAIGGITLLAKLAGVVGGSLLSAPLTVAGYGVEYVAWTVGFGATLLALHDLETTHRPWGRGHRAVSPEPHDAPGAAESPGQPA